MYIEYLLKCLQELLTQVLPLINYKVLKRRIKMFLFSNANKGKIKTYVNHTIKTKCVICDDFPVMPCIISVYCPHLACYYCIKVFKTMLLKILYLIYKKQVIKYFLFMTIVCI